ncbi:sigma-54-dependent Fis family transcriptional regulator [Caldimonas sp. KR1-144]|uniref:sigma-54-dependent Fis family transcriptional regulator n=1 Tax=Caldimonas sp. KR1-144 TaxID=3400911 RepID=UPI003C124B95
MSLTLTPTDHRHAHRVLEVVEHGNAVGTAAETSDLVARSWQRCLQEHHLHPDRPRKPPVIGKAALDERCLRLADLIDCARYEMTTLYQQLADPESAVVLTDTDGVIMHMVSSPEFAEEVAPLGFHVGAVWSEAEAGTNGMGTCLAAAGPVAVRREDHFFTQFTSLTCSAVPVHDASGRMCAVLDVTSRSGLQQQHLLVLLGMTAQMIENRLLDLRYRDAHPVHFHSRPEFVYTLHEGKLAVAADGHILAGNRSALMQLGFRSVEELRLKRVEDIFQTSLENLLDRSSRSAYHPVVTYRAANAANRFFAVARRPAADAASERNLRPSPAAQRSRGATVDAVDAAISSPPAVAARENVGFGDPRLAEQFLRATRAIAREIPVLLHGETGAGKEVFARALHAKSPNAAGAFVAVNCASLPESLIESELFGYRAGAFTGAQRTGRRGKILQADRGTLFLDEIGDMPLELQARLLRVLDERQVTPLGSEDVVSVQFQLVSASHRDLGALVQAGRFREDLYYRLCGYTVALPSLRERSDKRELILGLLAAEAGAQATLSPAALARLMQHAWPGNVRQLRHVLRTAVALADGDRIDVAHLPALSPDGAVAGTPMALPAPTVMAAEPEAANDEAPDETAAATAGLNLIQANEREVLLRLLQDQRWNVSNVAKALHVSRNTLYRKLHKLHIPLSHQR